MPKQLRDYPIYIAPQIRGHKDRNGQPTVFDERTNRNLDPNNIDDKIVIYERQVKDWFLNRASKLVNGNKNGFIVLMISISYIEGVQQYMNGQTSHNNSARFFREGIRRIFQLNEQDHVLNDFYAQVRCGLFHSGMTQNKVIISREYEQVIDFSEYNTIKINPKLFLRAIRLDFNRYVSVLKNTDNNEERDRFSQMFSNM